MILAFQEGPIHVNDGPLFCNLPSKAIVSAIRTAEHSVCYAAPGMQIEPAQAMAQVAARIGPELITVCLDFDERVMRMGFGDLDAVKILREGGIEVRSTTGLRSGLLIIDHHGYIFTPTALYLEADERRADAPNAMRLSEDQVTEALARLSPAAKAIAIAMAKSDEDRQRIRNQAVEVPSTPIAASALEEIEERFSDAPPVRFNIARQVRVFSAYLQYAKISLTGIALERRRISIPPSIQQLGGAEEIRDRLKTTFDLIEKGGKLSSRDLEAQLKAIRKKFTPSLGKKYDGDCIVLISTKADLEERLNELWLDLQKHKETVKRELQDHIDQSCKLIVNYYTPLVLANPPNELLGQGHAKIDKDIAAVWIKHELERTKTIPNADELVEKMQLEVSYKDVTFETLNHEDFLEAIKVAFPSKSREWDMADREFLAAGEEKE